MCESHVVGDGRRFQIELGVPQDGVNIPLSFNGYEQLFSLSGETHTVTAIRLSNGRIMVDLTKEIGHGVPAELLEKMGCTLRPVEKEVHCVVPVDQSRANRFYHFC